MAIERDMVLEKKERWVSPTSQMELRVKLIILPKDQEGNGKYLPAKGPGNGQDGNGGDEGRDDKMKFRNTKYDFEDTREEESDTEDSYELEITPRQLNQVTPGGGVLKIKLSKKRPIKITAGVPEGKPDLAQTKVKTVHEPINKESGQPPSSVSLNVLTEIEQPKEKGPTFHLEE